jgi:hypothetical protein
MRTAYQKSAYLTPNAVVSPLLFNSLSPRGCSSSRSFIIIKLLSWRTSFSRVWTGARAPAASLRALRSTRLHNFLRVMGVVCL